MYVNYYGPSPTSALVLVQPSCSYSYSTRPRTRRARTRWRCLRFYGQGGTALMEEKWRRNKRLESASSSTSTSSSRSSSSSRLLPERAPQAAHPPETYSAINPSLFHSSYPPPSFHPSILPSRLLGIPATTYGSCGVNTYFDVFPVRSLGA
jgi:hypothetical protein